MSLTFANLVSAYRRAGYYPRPVKPGTKSPPMKSWNSPDPVLEAAALDSWISDYADHGIGLVSGSPFPDGTTLAVVDIDRDDYARVASVLLGSPPSGRVGNKGIAYFVRMRGTPSAHKFKVTTPDGVSAIGDLLFGGAFCVIPPTVHPTTGLPYRWVGSPLLEVPYQNLPLLEA
jgi:hypothetical protein